MVELGNDFADLLIALADERAEFLVVGGWAARDHAEGLEAERYGYRFGFKPQLIELLTTISGVRFDDAWPERQVFELQGRQIAFLGRRALLQNKRAAGRPKDLADVSWLESHPDDER